MDRFWIKVRKAKPDECWEWAAGKTKDGYGMFRINGTMRQSQRVAYELTHNVEIISSKILVCHSCDNPSCCNPNHLWLGSKLDNNKDRHKKGRDGAAYGESHYNTRISKKGIELIRKLHRIHKWSYRKISDLFEVHFSHVGRIVNRQKRIKE